MIRLAAVFLIGIAMYAAAGNGQWGVFAVGAVLILVVLFAGFVAVWSDKARVNHTNYWYSHGNRRRNTHTTRSGRSSAVYAGTSRSSNWVDADRPKYYLVIDPGKEMFPEWSFQCRTCNARIITREDMARGRADCKCPICGADNTLVF